MSIQEDRELARRFFETAYIRHDFDEAKKFLTPDYKLHDAACPDFAGGPENWKKWQSGINDGITGHRCDILQQICEDGFVTTYWRATGTHGKELFGMPPTNHKIQIDGFTLSRIINGKIAEEWQVWDRLGLMAFGIRL